MRLGILTFHRSHNYGATLQAYALQEYLKSIGNEVYIIDYNPLYDKNLYLRDSSRLWLSKNLRMCFLRLLNYIKTRKKRHDRWDNFNRFFKERYNLIEYNCQNHYKELDAIFLGSDQIWSASHTGGEYDPVFFGKGFDAKIISYAPSTSTSSFDLKDKEQLSLLLENVDFISVREDSFKELLISCTSKDISVVCDPTILAGKNIFDKLIKAPKSKPNSYVLIYEIIHHPELYNAALNIASQLGVEIIELTNGISLRHHDGMREEASPEEFLWYFKNASCILTTSFHGTAFSLIFERPFYTMVFGKAKDNRMTNLLNRVGLSERIIRTNDRPTFSEINYKEISQNLESLRTNSFGFIQESLQN